MKCKKCGAKQDDSFLFCSKCGSPLKNERSCEKCGKTLAADADFCPFCGARIEPETVTPYGSAPLPETASASTAASAAPIAVTAAGKKPRGHVMELVRLWTLTGVLALMFGLSFCKLGVVKDIPYPDGGDIAVKFSAADAVEAMFAEKMTLEDLTDDFTEFVANEDVISPNMSKAAAKKAVIKAMEKYNALKFAFAQEAIDALPFSSRLMLWTLFVSAWAALLAPLAMLTVMCVFALRLTLGHTDYKNVKSGSVFFAVPVGVSAFIICIFGAIGLSAGAAPVWTLSLAIFGLAANLVYGAVLKKNRPTTRTVISRLASSTLAFTLLFTLSATAIRTEYTLDTKNTDYTVKEKYGLSDYAAAIDFSMAEQGDYLYLDDTFIADQEKQLADMITALEEAYSRTDMQQNALKAAVIEGIRKAVNVYYSPMAFNYYKGVSDGYGAGAAVLGGFTLVFCYLAAAAAAFLLCTSLLGIDDGNKKASFAAHVALAALTVILLALTAICIGSTVGLVKQTDVTYKIAITAAPIINLILALGAFGQYIVLSLQDKRAKTADIPAIV
ncbi:MAG: zinc ribbon domain-containing protein [Clostridiales bacterium]|jgi:hypothetical protein|nr:zinc ribbon domain-containing protein [Clostridiales bacterium]